MLKKFIQSVLYKGFRNKYYHFNFLLRISLILSCNIKIMVVKLCFKYILNLSLHINYPKYFAFDLVFSTKTSHIIIFVINHHQVPTNYISVLFFSKIK